MKKLNTLRKRYDGNIFRCVTVDDIKDWNKFSYRVFENEKEIETKEFPIMWDAIHYFENEIYNFMKEWMNISK